MGNFNLQNMLTALLAATHEPINAERVQGILQRYHAERAEESGEADAEQQSAETLPEEGHKTSSSGADKNLAEAEGSVPNFISETQIDETFAAIGAQWDAEGSPMCLRTMPAGYQMATRAAYGQWVRLLREEPRPRRLSPAALETLAIVAYRQPITRTDIEAIRGVACDAPLRRLQELELVEALTRAELPGRPLQYTTTPRMLEACGLANLNDLPTSDILSEDALTKWLHARREGEAPNKETNADLGFAETEAETEPAAEATE